MFWQTIKNWLIPPAEDDSPVIQNTNERLLGAFERHQAGDLEKAEAIYQSILEEQPDEPNALHLLGVIALQSGNYEIAVGYIERAISVNSQVADFFNNCGEAYRGLGKHDLAVARYEQALSINDKYTDAYNNLGNILNHLGKTREAIDNFKHALALKPDFAEAHNNLGNSLNDLGQSEQAIDHLEQALTIKPEMAEAHNNLGNALHMLGRYQDAIGSYKQALHIRSDYDEAHSNLGGSLQELGRTQSAITHYQRALVIKPDHPVAHNNLGLALQELGRKDESIAHFEQALSIKPDYSEAHYHLALIKPTQDKIPTIKQFLANTGIAEKDEIYFHYALGRIYNEGKMYDLEFEHYQKANILNRKTLSYDAKTHSDFVSRIMGTCSNDYFQKLESSGSDSQMPVFIVGMPRSGTTLVEQIISNHPSVHGAGELIFFEQLEAYISHHLSSSNDYPECLSDCRESTIRELSVKYLSELKILSYGEKFVIDKNPGNFLRIGLIKILFPGAKIVHCKREALDTCISIYLNNFVHGNDYQFDLAEIGQYYLDYERLMEYWIGLFPNDIINVQYEDLVMNQENISREMIAFLELEWDEKCLDFHNNIRTVRTASNMQVRQPIYNNSIDRWKRYEKYLAPLKTIIQ